MKKEYLTKRELRAWAIIIFCTGALFGMFLMFFIIPVSN